MTYERHRPKRCPTCGDWMLFVVDGLNSRYECVNWTCEQEDIYKHSYPFRHIESEVI